MSFGRSSILRWFAVPIILVVLHLSAGSGARAQEGGLAAAAGAATEAPSPGPDDVITGVSINDLHELDFRTHNYTVDFYVWFRWRNKDISPAKTMEFMNRSDPDDHVRDMVTPMSII